MTTIPIGIYIGNPNNCDPAQQAAVQAQFNSFVQAVGVAPAFMDTYVDFTIDWSKWQANANWAAQSWAASPWLAGVIPVIGLPMALAVDVGNQDQVFRAIIAGSHDKDFNAVFTAWKNAGYGTFYIRPGWEMNLPGMPWYQGSDPQTQADFVAAFRHIATLAHDFQGATIKVVWNPNVSTGSAVPVTALYPGNAYVDVIGLDEYSQVYPCDLYDWAKNNGTFDSSLAAWAANPVNLLHYYEYPGGSRYNPTGAGTNQFGVLQAQAFALAQGKPFSLPETGAGSVSGQNSAGLADNPTFVQFLQAALTAVGAPATAFANIWDVNAANYRLAFSGQGSLPLEAAAWQALASGVAAALAGLVRADTTPPAVTGIAVAPGNADLAAGQSVTFTVSFSEAVRVAGKPALVLNDGGTAGYVSGSGSATLTFKYTVAAGQNISALAVTGSLLPAGAGITDAAGNAAGFSAAVLSGVALSGRVIVDTARTRTTIAAGTGQVVSAGRGNDVVVLSAGSAEAVFHGSNDIAFLGGGTGAVNATLDDLSSGLTVYVLNGGNDVFYGLAFDTSAVVDLLGGIGGYAHVADVLKALTGDGHGGARLSLGGGHSIDFAGVAPGALQAANFHIG